VWAQLSYTKVAFGQHDANWLGFYDFFGRELSLAAPEKLSGLMEIARGGCGWWWPFDGEVVLSEPAEVLDRDDRGRLHSTSGPAMRYADGFELYAVHGTRLTIEQHQGAASRTLTPTEILGESNTESRRAMIDLYGPAQLMQAADPKVIDEDEMWGRLLRIDIPGDESMVMVDVLNNTCELCTRSIGEATPGTIHAERCECPQPERKPYMLRVPPTTTTALEGLAWMAETTPELYAANVMAQA